jgi:DNA mismatch repair protein MutS
LICNQKQKELLDIIKSKNGKSAREVIIEFTKIIKYYRNRINIEAIDSSEIYNIIKSGISPELDKARNDYSQSEKDLELIRKELSELVRTNCKNWSDRYKNDVVMIKTFKENKREVIRLDITKNRFNKLKKSCKDNKLVLSLEAKTVGDRCRLSNLEINQLSDKIITARDKIEPIIENEFKKIMDNLIKKYSCLNHISNCVAKIDVIQSVEYLSTKYNYCKPKIVKSNKSFLDIKQLRHPVIERIIDNIYIPNDIKIGVKDNIDGIIIYGLNSVGKSSLIKSVCLNTILAQAGIYTCASEFTYWPYKNIFTRLPGTDNQYLGMSNFICEVMYFLYYHLLYSLNPLLHK